MGCIKTGNKKIVDYTWPGNIRELENAIEHAFVLSEKEKIQLADLPIEIRDPSCYPQLLSENKNAPSRRRKKPTKEQLITLLKETDWNKMEVSRTTGISRTSIWK